MDRGGGSEIPLNEPLVTIWDALSHGANATSKMMDNFLIFTAGVVRELGGRSRDLPKMQHHQAG
jgi:hypothetical protein